MRWVLALLCLGAPASAFAQAPRTSSLSWVRLAGADGCVSTRALAEAVERRLGRPVFVSAAVADVSVEGQIAPAPAGGWRALVTVRSADGEPLGTRELETSSPGCRALDASLTLVIAVLIDPDAPAAPPIASDPATPGEVSATPAPPRVVIRRVVVRVSGRPDPRVRIGLASSVVLALGLLPGFAGGLEGALGVELPIVGLLRVEGQLWLPTDARAGGTGATFSRATAGLSWCPIRPRIATAVFRGCAGVQVGSLGVRPLGLDQPQAQDRLIVDAVARGALERRLVGPLWGRFGLGLVVPFVRDRFTSTRPDGSTRELFRAQPVALLGDAGLALVFP